MSSHFRRPHQLAGNHGADNRAAGRWRGSTSKMARRAQRAGREQGKAAPSMGMLTSLPEHRGIDHFEFRSRIFFGKGTACPARAERLE